MYTKLNLKEIERKAFRAAHQDGLWDIYIGGIVLSMAMLASTGDGDAFPTLRFGLFIFGLLLSYLIFWGGKKYLTTPRLGQVKFGPQRQRRKLIMEIVLACVVLLQAFIFIGTVLLWRNPQWAETLGLAEISPDMERLLVAVIGGLIVGPSMVLISYFNEFMRGYYIAFILSLGVFSLIWFDAPRYLIAASLLIILPGVVLFIRFLRQHPLPPVEASRD